MSGVEPGELDRLLRAWADGDRKASDRVWSLVQGELRQLAGYHFRRERPDHTLQPTAIVNEVYLRLASQQKIDWRDKAHFIGACSQMIRRILVDHARAHLSEKRGGDVTQVTLTEQLRGSLGPTLDVLDLEAALSRLAEMDPRQERIIELRFFGGLSIKEVGALLEISEATVKREWTVARAWLYQELANDT